MGFGPGHGAVCSGGAGWRGLARHDGISVSGGRFFGLRAGGLGAGTGVAGFPGAGGWGSFSRLMALGWMPGFGIVGLVASPLDRVAMLARVLRLWHSLGVFVAPGRVSARGFAGFGGSSFPSGVRPWVGDGWGSGAEI